MILRALGRATGFVVFACCSPVLAAAEDSALSLPPGLPRTAELEQIESWIQALDSPDWANERRVEIDSDYTAQGKARWSIGLKSGFIDCNKVLGRGEMVVENGGKTRTGLRRFQGGMGTCGPAGWGRLEYADGRVYVGPVANETTTSMVEVRFAGIGLWTNPNGRRELVSSDVYGTQTGLATFGPPGEWWAQGTFDILWNTAMGTYGSGDGATFQGPLSAGKPGGAGLWRFDSPLVQISGVGTQQGDRVVLTGPIELVLRQDVVFRDAVTLGAGRYALDAGTGWSPGSALDGADLRPFAESLTVTTRQPNCPLTVTPPPGWKPWGPSCADRSGASRRLDIYSPDGRFVLQHRSSDGHRIDESTLVELDGSSPLKPTRTWTAARFAMSAPPTPVGETQYTEGGVLKFIGPTARLAPDGAGLCAIPTEEGQGMEPCEFRAGQRVDQIFHLRRQRQLQMTQQAQQQAALVAAQQAEQRRQAQLQAAQQAAQPQQQGFQWGKLAALGVGAALGGAGKLDAESQANILTGMVKDSMGGQQGISGLQTAAAAIGGGPSGASLGAIIGSGGSVASSAASGGTTGAGPGAVAPGSYPARPNTLEGDPACSGYTVENYKSVYGQNSNGPDAQLHALCAGAYNYYWMYLNAIRKGYDQADSDLTYAAFTDAAQVASSFYRNAR